MNNKAKYTVLTLLWMSMAMFAMGGRSVGDDDDELVRRYLPGQLRDTAAFNNQMQQELRRDGYAQVYTLARAYGDSIVLRWAPEDYVSWKYLCNVGVNILRTDLETNEQQLVAEAYKPLPLDEFRSRYALTDSLAGMAMGTLYGRGDLNVENTQSGDAVGSLFEVHGEQQMKYGVAGLVSEWRQDLANALCLRFADRSVEKGHAYSYRLYPSLADSTGNVLVAASEIAGIRNTRYEEQAYDIEIKDSLSRPYNVTLVWRDRGYSSYEIERRKAGTGTWQRVNKRPYLVMTAMSGADEPNMFQDDVNEPGDYEYRIFAHDPFGDLTTASAIHKVSVPKMMPPQPPQITHIVIDRRNADDPSAEIYANIHFRKDLREPDYTGCVPLYYHQKITNGEWRPLINEPLPPGDSICVVNVTNLMTGQITMAAYDSYGNVSYSMPQMLRISDMKAPDAPKGLKAVTSIKDGTIKLSWDRLPDDDIDYYEVVFANDTTHNFVDCHNGFVGDTVFVDSVALDANQKYIYYKVRAVDYATNMGSYSDVLEVVRPSILPPTVAHIDSAWVNDNGINMRWITGSDHQISHHKIYRRQEGQKQWQLLRICDGDSVRAVNNRLEITDTPRHSPKRYEYYVESFNYSDVSSGASLVYSASYKARPVVSIPIKLEGVYDASKRQTRIAWELDATLADAQAGEGFEWYFCIYRQGPDDAYPKFFIATDKNERTMDDRLLNPGEEARYYVVVQLDNACESTPSNTLVVKAEK